MNLIKVHSTTKNWNAVSRAISVSRAAGIAGVTVAAMALGACGTIAQPEATTTPVTTIVTTETEVDVETPTATVTTGTDSTAGNEAATADIAWPAGNWPTEFCYRSGGSMIDRWTSVCFELNADGTFDGTVSSRVYESVAETGRAPHEGDEGTEYVQEYSGRFVVSSEDADNEYTLSLTDLALGDLRCQDIRYPYEVVPGTEGPCTDNWASTGSLSEIGFLEAQREYRLYSPTTSQRDFTGYSSEGRAWLESIADDEWILTSVAPDGQEYFYFQS